MHLLTTHGACLPVKEECRRRQGWRHTCVLLRVQVSTGHLYWDVSIQPCLQERSRGMKSGGLHLAFNVVPCYWFGAGEKLRRLLSDEDEEEAEAREVGKGGRAKSQDKGRTRKGGGTLSGKRKDATLQSVEDSPSDLEEESEGFGSDGMDEEEDDDDEEEEDEPMEVERDAWNLDQDR